MLQHVSDCLLVPLQYVESSCRCPSIWIRLSNVSNAHRITLPEMGAMPVSYRWRLCNRLCSSSYCALTNVDIFYCGCEAACHRRFRLPSTASSQRPGQPFKGSNASFSALSRHTGEWNAYVKACSWLLCIVTPCCSATFISATNEVRMLALHPFRGALTAKHTASRTRHLRHTRKPCRNVWVGHDHNTYV
jgi:hypothetical protein